MTPIELIIRKREGRRHSAEDIRALIRALMDGSMADYQLSAWLMAAFLRGLDDEEATDLALAMRDSGERVEWGAADELRLDKHSSGGVGDKTTIAVVPMLAAAGVPMLKMSGRGLGFAGGTVDKLESIPGFRTDLSIDEARAQVARIGAALIGQSPSLAPADKKLYALRDVTGTVESLPLIASSVMSKKLAAGANAILLDVKAGRGAYLKSWAETLALARLMVRIGRGASVPTVALVTDMDEPLGRAVGNALEVAEACALLTGEANTDLRFKDLCVSLAAKGLILAGKAPADSEARETAMRLIADGFAARKLEELVEAQGGDPRVIRNRAILPRAASVHPIRALQTGYIASIDAEEIGRLAMSMGAGRMRKEDRIDPAVGIVLTKKTGERVEEGETLAELHCPAESNVPAWESRLLAAFSTTPSAPAIRQVVLSVVE